MLNGWAAAGWAAAAGGRLGQHVERERRVEHQAARQNPHEPASHVPSGNLDLSVDIPMKRIAGDRTTQR